MRCTDCGHDNPSDALICISCGAELPLADLRPNPASEVSLSPNFVGRRRQMAELVSALDDALAGRGRLVMLVGEPGIGKTRTAEELAALAQQRGFEVLWGRCHEERGPPPYWPWVQTIRSYVGEREAGQLRLEMGAGASDIAQVVPDVQERLPDLQAARASDDPDQARFRLFSSITSFLNRASQNQPLVLVLDNLHWADASSLRLLEFVAQEMSESRLLVVGTYRDVDVSRGHPLYRALGELTRLRSFQRVLMRGLNEQEVGLVIEAVGGTRPSAQLASRVHRETEGNPLFVGEIARLLAQEGVLSADDGDFRLPEGIREVIGRRLDRLSAECNEVLRVASVIGRRFSLEQLERLVDANGDRLLDILDEAASARIIEELPRSPGNYQFSHTLIRRTLQSELTTTRRVRVHARILKVSEELYAGELPAHADELARHAAEGEVMIGAEKLARYSAMAGEQALAAYAWEEAIYFFERIRAATHGRPLNAQSAQAIFGLGRAQCRTARDGRTALFDEGMANLRLAFDYFMQIGDVANAVAVAESYPMSDVPDIQGSSLVSRALAMAPSGSHQEARLLSRYVLFLTYHENRYAEAQTAFKQAIAIAERESDDALKMRTLGNAASLGSRK